VQEPPPQPRQHNPRMPVELEGVILQALEKDPARRFADSAGFAEALGKLLPALPARPAAGSTLLDPNAAVETGGAAMAAGHEVSGLSDAYRARNGVSLSTLLEKSLIKPRGPSVLDEFPQVAPQNGVDHIQVLEPEKTARTIPVRTGVITVGRIPDNQLMLDDPKVSRHHLRIEQSGSRYTVTDLGSSNGSYLGGVKSLKDVTRDWDSAQPLKVGGTYLKLVRAREVVGTQMDSGHPSVIRQEQARTPLAIKESQLTVEPGSSVPLELTIRNQGEAVEHYRISLAGLQEAWVKNLPREPLQCMPGEEQTLTLHIQPPRSPQSRAGHYPLALHAASQGKTGEVVSTYSNLTIAPFRQFSSQMHPERIQTGRPSRVRVANQGNLPELFQINWRDPADELSFEPPEASLKVEEGRASELEFRGRLRQVRWIGGEKSHRFQAEISLADAQPQALIGEIISQALIPAWVPPLLISLCLFLAFGLGAFYRFIYLPPKQETKTAVFEIAQKATSAFIGTELYNRLNPSPTITPTITLTPTPTNTLTETPTSTLTPKPTSTMIPTRIPTVTLTPDPPHAPPIINNDSDGELFSERVKLIQIPSGQQIILKVEDLWNDSARGYPTPNCMHAGILFTWSIREPYPTNGDGLEFQREGLTLGQPPIITLGSGASGSSGIPYCGPLTIVNNSLTNFKVEFRYAAIYYPPPN
jgi:FHA domain